MAGQDVGSLVREFVNQARATILHNGDSQEIEAVIPDIFKLLSINDKDDFPLDCNRHCAQKIFISEHYIQVLWDILGCLSIEFITNLSTSCKLLLDQFFLDGPPTQCLTVIADAINFSRGAYQLQKCVGFLEAILRKHAVSEVMWEQCLLDKTQGLPEHAQTHLWSQLPTQIVSLPDRVFARLHTETSEIFYPRNYIPLIIEDLWRCLENIHKSIKNDTSCSVIFVSQVFGRLCITGHGCAIWKELFPLLINRIRTDYIWCRIAERLITGVPDTCLESVLTPLLIQAPHHDVVVKLLGQSILHNMKIELLLTHKLLMIRTFDKNIFLYNVFGYISSCTSMKPLSIKVFKQLLLVWGDGSAIRHTPYQQHFYISKAIIISAIFLSSDMRTQLKKDVLCGLMPGVEAHLTSPLQQVHTLGMVVAELLINLFDPSGEKLKFEYEEDDTTRELKGLAVPPCEKALDDMIIKFELPLLEEPVSTIEPKTNNAPHADIFEKEEQLDSDDDLEPFDLSNDRKMSKATRPSYLRQCIEGLISSDDPDKIEACLTASEALIKKNPNSVKEVCVEFCKVLLHLDDKFSLTDFRINRHKSMIALIATCPEQVADYLTSQFYERNYNVRQRLDMLEVLAAGAQHLSQPTIESDQKKRILIEAVPELTPEYSEHWRDVVQRRIEKKTKRFGKGRQNPSPTPVMNKLAPVAGHFFFPLIRYFDRSQNTFDLLGSDYLLLSRLLYTLGVVIYAALHAPAVRQMAKALMEFIWIIRYHQQPAVRQSVFFALSMLLLAVPAHFLLTDLQNEITETREWLQDVISQDTNLQCKEQAMQSLLLLDMCLKQEISGR